MRPEEYPKPSSVRQGTARLRWWEDERWRSEVEVEFFSPSGEKLRTGNVSPLPPVSALFLFLIAKTCQAGRSCKGFSIIITASR